MCTIYTVLTNATGDVAYGEWGAENWYVVTNDVTISGQLYFADYTAHLIVCDGATLTISNENDTAISAYGLTIYCQMNATGAVAAKGIYSVIDGDAVIINGGNVTATGGDDGICAYVVTINGGNVTATGGIHGIYAIRGDITLGWTNPTDSIYASSYSGRVCVGSGKMLADGYGGIYEGDNIDPDDIAGKTLWPGFMDPEGAVINDLAIIEWLAENGFTQADINALGHDAAATDRLYECYLINCDFTAQDAGGALSITGIAVSNGVVSITVQFVRTAPLGFINGVLDFYGANDLAAGFGGFPIDDVSIDFGMDDPSFDTAPTAGTVTQSVTATFSMNVVTETFFKATIELYKPYEPEEPWEPEPEEPEPEPEE